MLYELTGSLNTAFILISLYGVWSQLHKIRARRRPGAARGETTAVLSLNQLTVSFLAYYCFFVYGYTIEPFNHYIVWPRLLAALLVLLILVELWRDRRSRRAAAVLLLAAAALAAGLAGLVWGQRYSDQGRVVASTLIVAITALIAQGYAHQIALIWRSGRTGAVSLRMSQFILMMDLSTIAFALAMGLADGWPLLLLAGVSGTTKLIIMWLFRWEQRSPRARARRRGAPLPAMP